MKITVDTDQARRLVEIGEVFEDSKLVWILRSKPGNVVRRNVEYVLAARRNEYGLPAPTSDELIARIVELGYEFGCYQDLFEIRASAEKPWRSTGKNSVGIAQTGLDTRVDTLYELLLKIKEGKDTP